MKKKSPDLFCIGIKFLISFSFAAGYCNTGCGQNAGALLLPDSSVQTIETTVIDTFVYKKKFWRASGELFITELVPWSYNYFIRKADFAKISFESIWYNLNPGHWEWDDNSFKTNQFAHPYHGNLYFSSFRSNGYSFWQAAPAAFAGSFIWEVAGETHPPAPNDFINTSLGGISLGEMTYRLSNTIVNNRQRGFGRQLQEVGAFLVNPLNGLNRVIDGEWGRVHYGPKDTANITLSATLDVGIRRFSEKTADLFSKGKNEFYARMRLQYGEPYKESSIPFNNFSLLIETGASDSALINTVQVNGALKQKLVKEKNETRHIYSITMNYDYFHNSSFEYGAQSFNFKILSEWNKEKRTKIYTRVGAGWIVLAAVPDDYLYYGEGRNYDYGTGASFNAGSSVNIRDKLICSLNYTGGWFITLNGNESSFFLNTLSADLKYLFTRRFSLEVGLGHYSLNGYYKNYADVDKRFPFVRYSVGYKLFEK